MISFWRKFCILLILSWIMAGCNEDLPSEDDYTDEDPANSSYFCECNAAIANSSDCAFGRTERRTWSARRKACSEAKPLSVICCESIKSSPRSSSTVIFSKPILVASAGEALVIGKRRPLYNDFSCVDECSNQNSFLCERVDDLKSISAKNAFRELQMLIAKGNTRIPKQKLLTLFNQTDDPCERSDLRFIEGKLINDGLSCTATSIIAGLPTDNIKLTIRIPPVLTGTINSEKNAISFDYEDDSFLLEISDQDLNTDFGGFVHRIELHKNDFIIETDTGCLSL